MVSLSLSLSLSLRFFSCVLRDFGGSGYFCSARDTVMYKMPCFYMLDYIMVQQTLPSLRQPMLKCYC